MNPLSHIPAVWRSNLYLGWGVGSVVTVYLAAVDVIGAAEVAGWTSLGAFLGFTAFSNTDRNA